jgi:hypothetical protein
MAEERLIDRDKDNKYRIRVNEDGEEELVVNDGFEEESEEDKADEVSFEVPDNLEEDDEEAAAMTPEQLAEKRRNDERLAKEREEKLASLIQSATDDMAKNNFSTALEYAYAAEKLDPENGHIHALKLKIFTRNFTDYSAIEQASEVCDDVQQYSSAEEKAEMFAVAGEEIENNIKNLKVSVEALHKENEQKREERAVKFDADKKRALRNFIIAVVPFVVFLTLTIIFGTQMFADQSGVIFVLAIVFASLALVSLIAVMFLSRQLNTALRRVRLNKKDNTTKLGRQYLAEKSKLEAFEMVYSTLQNKD